MPPDRLGAAGSDLGVLRSLAIILIVGATIGMTAAAARLSREVVDQHEARTASTDDEA